MAQSRPQPLDQVLLELKRFGFRIKEKFLVDIYGEGGRCSFAEAMEELLHCDFRKNDYLEPFFGATVNTVESDTLEGPAVLQVTSVTNISQPTKRQHEDCTPRVLLIKLNDGHSTANAIEYERIPDLNCKIAPGTKILIKNNVQIFFGKIFLNAKSCRVLGGRVDHLYNAWLTNRNTLSSRKSKKQDSNSIGDAPPAFELKIVKRTTSCVSSTKIATDNTSSTIPASEATTNTAQPSKQSKKDRVPEQRLAKNKKSSGDVDVKINSETEPHNEKGGKSLAGSAKMNPKPNSQLGKKQSNDKRSVTSTNEAKSKKDERANPPPVPSSDKKDAKIPERNKSNQKSLASKHVPNRNNRKDSSSSTTAQQHDMKQPKFGNKNGVGVNFRDEKRNSKSRTDNSNPRSGSGRGKGKSNDNRQAGAPSTAMSSLSLYLPADLPPPPPTSSGKSGSEVKSQNEKKSNSRPLKKYTFS